MSDWKPTIGKWDAPEQYNMNDPIWKSALTYAESKLNAVNAKMAYKDGRTTKDIPYVEFIQQVLAVLIQEANKHDDYTLLIAALCRLQERAGCSYQEIADKYTDNLCTVLSEGVRLHRFHESGYISGKKYSQFWKSLCANHRFGGGAVLFALGKMSS